MANETVRYVMGIAMAGSIEFRLPKLRIELWDVVEALVAVLPSLGRLLLRSLPDSRSP